MTKRTTTIVAAIAEQLGVDMDRHLFSWRAPEFLRLKLNRLAQIYGQPTVHAALRLRYREDRANYRAELRKHRQLQRQKQTSV
jgi:hypothetical protein